jgi:Uma2 family endonuclease
MIVLARKPYLSLAEVLDSLGNVPIERLRLPLGTATEDDVIEILERKESPACELIDGILVEKTVGFRESMIAMEIAHALRDFVMRDDLGVVFGPDGPIRLRLGLVRIPDAGFISWDKFPNDEVPEDAICKVTPDLAVEVVSKHNTRAEMEQKLREYFQAGVRLVWYIYPNERRATVFTSPARRKEIDASGMLEGGKVLPGFSLPVATVFSPLRRRKPRR